MGDDETPEFIQEVRKIKVSIGFSRPIRGLHGHNERASIVQKTEDDV